MKLIRLVSAAMILVVLVSQAYAVTLTFDDIPDGMTPGEYYSSQYGIGCGSGFYAADHTGSTWGPPHSGSNVLVWSYPGFPSNAYGMMFKNDLGPLYAYSVGGYFSTEPGVVLQMIGYYQTLDNPVALVFIGSSGESWNNVYVQISSGEGMNMVEFKPVTTDALLHFCADDVTVEFVPEPASALALVAGLVALALRRRGT